MNRTTQGIRFVRLLSLVLALSIAGCQEKPDDAPAASDTLVARINGEPIRLEEIERSAGWRLHRARLDVHRILESETDRQLEERLLERHASPRGIEVAPLIEEVVAHVQPVTDQEVEQYFIDHPSDIAIDAARPRIRHYLEERRRIERRLALVERLRAEAEVETYLQAPTRPRIELDLKGAPARGEVDAPIVIVQFADLSRDESLQSARDLSQLERAFPGRIRLLHRSLPRERDEIGLLTAQLAAAADQQNLFWALRDQLTLSSGVRNRAELEAIATAIDLNLPLASLAGETETLSRVQHDLKAAHRAGVRRAPTLFVNGRYFMGLEGYPALRELVVQELDEIEGAE